VTSQNHVSATNCVQTAECRLGRKVHDLGADAEQKVRLYVRERKIATAIVDKFSRK